MSLPKYCPELFVLRVQNGEPLLFGRCRERYVGAHERDFRARSRPPGRSEQARKLDRVRGAQRMDLHQINGPYQNRWMNVGHIEPNTQLFLERLKRRNRMILFNVARSPSPGDCSRNLDVRKLRHCNIVIRPDPFDDEGCSCLSEVPLDQRRRVKKEDHSELSSIADERDRSWLAANRYGLKRSGTTVRLECFFHTWVIVVYLYSRCRKLRILWIRHLV